MRAPVEFVVARHLLTHPEDSPARLGKHCHVHAASASQALRRLRAKDLRTDAQLLAHLATLPERPSWRAHHFHTPNPDTLLQLDVPHWISGEYAAAHDGYNLVPERLLIYVHQDDFLAASQAALKEYARLAPESKANLSIRIADPWMDLDPTSDYCVRRVVFIIYPKATPEGERSLGAFLNDASANRWNQRLPLGISQAFSDMAWWKQPGELRNQSVHSDPGTCHSYKGKVSYMASRPLAGDASRAENVEDILGKIDSWFDQLNQVIGRVFHTLNDGLTDKEIQVICGLYNGRVYERFVKPPEATYLGAGRCKSKEWFDKEPEENKCLLRDRCDAYKR